MNCIICAIAKNENQYLYEWAKHHIGIGFNHIHIYDNNDTDGERIRDVFSGTDLEDRITVHDVRGKVMMQLSVYQECYDKEEFDWCAFIDIDEFITFTVPEMTISEFLSDKVDFDAVHLNWLCYGDDEQISKGEGGVMERFKNPIMPIDFVAQYVTIPDNAHIKSVVKQGLDVDWGGIIDNQLLAFVGAQPHTPAGLNQICNAKGETVENLPWNPICHEKVYIAHYITKSLEEYQVKMSRKAADSNKYIHNYSVYFRYNRITLQKLTFTQTAVWLLLKDAFVWWNFKHRTPFARFYRKYRRKLKQEAYFAREWIREKH